MSAWPTTRRSLVARAPSGARRRGEAGFTLIELLIVLVILAMAATLVAPSVEAGLRAREVRSAVRTIVATMRSAGSAAIMQGTPQEMLIDPVEQRIAVSDGEPLALGEFAAIREVVGGEVAEAGGVRVRFYPNGSTTGIALLVGDRTRLDEPGWAVRLDPLIGQISVEETP